MEPKCGPKAYWERSELRARLGRAKALAGACSPFERFRATIREFRARQDVARNRRPPRKISELLPLAVDARSGSALVPRAEMRRSSSSEDDEHASHYHRRNCFMHRRANVGTKAVRENRKLPHPRSQTITTSEHMHGSMSPEQD